MTDLPTNAVPLSRTPGSGTAGQLARTRDNEWDSSGTPPRNALAALRFRRPGPGQQVGQRRDTRVPETGGERKPIGTRFAFP